MSLPSALSVVYPPSFQNSFWSHPSYRPGAHSLYAQLQAGLDENESILAFVAHRAELEYSHAEALATPPPPPSFAAPLFRQAAGILHEVLPIDANLGTSSASTRGFAANTSATSRAFRMIQAEANTTHANAHGKVARHLEKSILEPFGKWAAEHRQRITHSWEHVDATLTRFERQKAEVDKLKHSYENKCRNADEAEDDVRFAPIEESDLGSPPPSQASQATPRPGSVLQRRSVSADSTNAIDVQQEQTDPEKLKRRETVRKQFGFTQRSTSATISPPNKSTEVGHVKLPPLPTETEGQAMQTGAETGATATNLKRSGTISAFVTSAVDKMPAPIKAAVGGVVSAESRHIRLRRDADNAEKVYEEAVRNLDRTRCQVEEVLFEHYGLTQRWEADRIRAVQSVLASYNQALAAQLPILQQSSTRSFKIHQGLDPSLELRALIRHARTGPFRPAMERFQPYYHDEISLGRKAGPHGVAHGWLIKNGGFGLDLSLVERLEYLDRLEHQQSGTSDAAGASQQLATLPPVLTALLAALDRAYADTERWTALAKALPALVSNAQDDDAAEPDAKIIGQEKRKIWILEVPLPITHRVRDALIAHLNPSLADLIYGNNGKGGDAAERTANPIPDKLLDSYDPPVLAACVKLWLLELEQSLITEDLWDQIDAIYRAAAAQEHEALAAATSTIASTEEKEAPAQRAEIDEATKQKIQDGVLEDLRVVLNKLPRIHLACLDALFSHLDKLVDATEATEPDAIYTNKLGLALGRALLRPKRESQYTVASQIGTLVVVDLVQHYGAIFPELVDKRLKESVSASPSSSRTGFAADGQRRTPIRKRTKPVDQRISRSSIGSDLQQGAKKLIEQLDEQQRGHREEPLPPVPALAAAEEKPQPQSQPSAPAAIDTLSTASIAASKQLDDAAAPTPLTDRVLTSSHPEAETVSVAADRKLDEQVEEKPLSNVARLSRQFNSIDRKRTSLGGVRGPRPAGARSARLSSHGGSGSATSAASAAEETGAG